MKNDHRDERPLGAARAFSAAGLPRAGAGADCFEGTEVADVRSFKRGARPGRRAARRDPRWVAVKRTRQIEWRRRPCCPLQERPRLTRR